MGLCLRAVLAVLVGCMLTGCKGSSSHGTGAVVGDAALADAGGALEAMAPLPPPPADEMIPPTSSDELTTRARHLLEAAGKDDPDLATDIAFPRSGWLAMRDADDPGKDWDRHVDSPFRRSLHALFRRHESLARAQFVSFELGHALVQAVPRRHGWKKPLWTVRGSHVTYTVDGHTRALTIREMTAWRGAWYITRLR
jgi:hypothetical protein